MSRKRVVTIGEEFGKLTIIKEVDQIGYRRRFSVECGCGVIKDVGLSELVTGNTLSCGCGSKGLIHASGRLLYGVGVRGDYLTVNDGRMVKSYSVWANMLERCHSSKFHSKFPAYKDCTISDEWIEYKNFLEWFDDNYVEGYALDKDLIKMGNKVYSSDTCIFIPQTVNSFIACSSKNKELPVGVQRSANGQRYKSRVSNPVTGVQFSKTFDTIGEANSHWLSEKRKSAKELSETLDDERIADLLLNFKFEDVK